MFFFQFSTFILYSVLALCTLPHRLVKRKQNKFLFLSIYFSISLLAMYGFHGISILGKHFTRKITCECSMNFMIKENNNNWECTGRFGPIYQRFLAISRNFKYLFVFVFFYSGCKVCSTFRPSFKSIFRRRLSILLHQ